MSDKSASQWAQVMADLYKVKPSSIAKRFGSRGPSSEQRAAYDAELKAWNSAYRHASKMQKIALVRDNEAFRNRKENPMPTAAQKAARAKFAAIMKSGGFPKRRKKNPVARPRSGTVAETNMRQGLRRSGRSGSASTAVERSKLHGVRRRNPLSRPVGYEVLKISPRGAHMDRLVATFAQKPDAVTFAKAYATKHKCQCGIIGKSARRA